MKMLMATKDNLNKISGIIALGMFLVIVSGYFTGNESLLGFPNAMLLYALMPLALIWFGTRKNGCGSCNQTWDISETEHEKK
jgi:hypothetical protein